VAPEEFRVKSHRVEVRDSRRMIIMTLHCLR
jgi:hypothetical protein